MRKEKAIQKFLHRIELKAGGIRMHIFFAENDKKQIIEKRKQLHLITDANDRSQITTEISEAKERFNVSSDIYKENVVIISRAIKVIDRGDSKISRYIVNRNEIMVHALEAAGEFYGDSIPAFPESPAAVYV